MELVVSGRIYEGPQFRHTPPPLRRLNDIALSGDGEPTAYANFEQVVDVCAEVRRRHGLDDVKLVLITNASLLQRPRVQRALTTLDANGGEIWAKLDAGTEDYYRLVARSAVPWRQILGNLAEAARTRPIVIQSLWMRIDGQPPPAAELAAYCDRLREIMAGGGKIKLVQVHTVRRKPAEANVAALANAEVDAIAELVAIAPAFPRRHSTERGKRETEARRSDRRLCSSIIELRRHQHNASTTEGDVMRKHNLPPARSPFLLPMPNLGPVATLFTADLPPALSGLLGTH